MTPEQLEQLVTRCIRAWSIACASQAWRGEPTDLTGILGLAEENEKYINGKDEAAIIPLNDPPKKGRIPKP